jgi:hypothetical protein
LLSLGIWMQPKLKNLRCYVFKRRNNWTKLR